MEREHFKRKFLQICYSEFAEWISFCSNLQFFFFSFLCVSGDFCFGIHKANCFVGTQLQSRLRNQVITCRVFRTDWRFENYITLSESCWTIAARKVCRQIYSLFISDPKDTLHSISCFRNVKIQSIVILSQTRTSRYKLFEITNKSDEHLYGTVNHLNLYQSLVVSVLWLPV